ncbi:uncharacterized protein [Argopecten irradians]|uniref:uncharacterized protein isoform X2 n=1 Tax=Argopecten irradians TaxID=31199 RepID=UPI00371F40FB
MEESDPDLSPIQERTSLCDSESSSVANMNYSGPGSPHNGVKPDLRGQYQHAPKKHSSEPTEVVVLFCNKPYFKSCTGMLRLFQVILSVISLVSLTSSFGQNSEDFLQLPLSWHFRVMLFVLVLTITTSTFLWSVHCTGLIYMLPVNWYFIVVGYICMFVYGLTALVGYRRWKIQHRLFKRKRLLEEEEDFEI